MKIHSIFGVLTFPPIKKVLKIDEIRTSVCQLKESTGRVVKKTNIFHY